MEKIVAWLLLAFSGYFGLLPLHQSCLRSGRSIQIITVFILLAVDRGDVTALVLRKLVG